MVMHARLQNYKRHYIRQCLTGLFGCRWHRYQQSTQKTKLCDLLSLAFLVLVTLYVFMWFYFWLIAKNDSNNFNWYIFDKSGSWYDYYTVVLALTCVVFGYILLLVILALCHVGWDFQVHIHLSHRIFLILIAAGCVGMTVIIEKLWHQGWTLQVVSLMITGPFLHIGAVALLTFLSWFIIGYWFDIYNAVAKVVIFLLYLTVMVGLYIAPLFINSPCVSVQPPHKPSLIAHRGAPSIAPENTLISFQKAVEYDIIALETDVIVSNDNVPFLCHDKDFRRTTNVKEIFPERADSPAWTFNISEIKTLDAGSWFVQRDPFGTASDLSESDVANFSEQTVPTLQQFLEIVKQNNISYLFDIKLKTVNVQDVEIIKETIINANLPQNWNMWLYYEKSNHTDFTWVADVKSEHWQDTNYLQEIGVQWINVELGKLSHSDVRRYQNANISVNIWVVNTAWAYSLYWCMGVDSVTTNHINLFSQIKAPIWHLTPEKFKIMWIVTDVISAVIIIIFIIIHRCRARGKSFRPERMSLQVAKAKMSQRKHNRVMKEKLLHTAEGLHEVDPGIVGMNDSESPAIEIQRFPTGNTGNTGDSSNSVANRMSGISTLSGISDISAISGSSGIADNNWNNDKIVYEEGRITPVSDHDPSV